MRLATDLGVDKSVTFTGPVRPWQVGDLLNSSDALVSTHDHSNLAIPVLEALSCPKPVITLADGSTDGVIEDSVNELLVRLEDGELALADAIVRLFTDHALHARLVDGAPPIHRDASADVGRAGARGGRGRGTRARKGGGMTASTRGAERPPIDPAEPFASTATRLAFHGKERLMRRHALREFQALAASERRSREDVLSDQAQRLAEIVTHARASVPHYRDTWARASPGAGLDGPASLSDLPFLEKSDIRDAGRRLFADGATGLVPGLTSGSTGARLVVYQDTITASRHLAHSIRGRGWWGLRIGDREAKYWGDAAPFSGIGGKFFAFGRRRKDAMLGVTRLSPFALSPEVLDAHVQILDRRRPRLLFGYGGALWALAQHMRRRGLAFDGWAPDAVIYTSETLYPHQKAEMEKAFGRRVASEYGSVETGIIAYECPRGRMHLSDETVVVEVVPGTGAGLPEGWGELALTHLVNRGMPIVRYRIGDVGALDEEGCACGRPFGVLKGVVGRSNDLLQKRNGDLIHPELFDYFMRGQPGIRRYRVVEEARGTLRVLVEPEPDAGRPDPDEVSTRLLGHLGEHVTIHVEVVSALSPDPSGKSRWIVPLPRAGRP